MILEKEISNISNPQLREAVTKCIQKREELLRIYPASIGGEYHPPDERGPGGLVLHIRRMVHLVTQVARQFGLSIPEYDQLLVACFLHDISNIDISFQDDNGRIIRNHDAYSHWHGTLSAQIAMRYIQDEGIDLESVLAMEIYGIISSHMGAWFPNDRQPSTKLEMIFSLLDFIGTRTNIHVEV